MEPCLRKWCVIFRIVCLLERKEALVMAVRMVVVVGMGFFFSCEREKGREGKARKKVLRC